MKNFKIDPALAQANELPEKKTAGSRGKKRIAAAIGRLCLIVIPLSLMLTSCSEAKDISDLGTDFGSVSEASDVTVTDGVTSPETEYATEPVTSPAATTAVTEPETVPAETEPATEAAPVVTEPVTEAAPVETEPAETKPVETEPAETKPVETQPAETKPAETEPPKQEPEPATPSDEELVKTKAGRLIIAEREAKRLVEEIITPDMTKYEKAKAICDYFYENVAQQDDQSPEAYKTNFGNEAYAAFVLKIAACSGTSKAVKMMCDLVGIECRHINQGKWTHQWNMVNLDDGSWPYSETRGYWAMLEAQGGFISLYHPYEDYLTEALFDW